MAKPVFVAPSTQPCTASDTSAFNHAPAPVFAMALASIVVLYPP